MEDKMTELDWQSLVGVIEQIDMDDECFCCFIPVNRADAHPIEASWQVPDSDLRMITTDLVVCTVCRRLDCDILTPEGCKRPEAKRKETRDD